VQSNEVFLHLGSAGAAALRAAGFEFYDWGATGSGEARLVVSWNQPQDDVDRLCDALQRLPAEGMP
jgi:threonine aldolase